MHIYTYTYIHTHTYANRPVKRTFAQARKISVKETIIPEPAHEGHFDYTYANILLKETYVHAKRDT